MKLDYNMENFLIENLFLDVKNYNVDNVFNIEDIYYAGEVMMKFSIENKTTTDFSVRNKNEMNLHEINCIECKTRYVSRTK